MPSKAHLTNVQPLGAPEQLLVNRVQTARMLGLSVPSVIRLELEGRLTAIKLSKKRTAMTFYRAPKCALLQRGGPDNDTVSCSARHLESHKGGLAPSW